MTVSQRRSLAVGLATLGLLVCPSAARADNLLANPGFEEEILGGPFAGPAGNWEPATGPGGITRQGAVVKSGAFALAITGSPEPLGGWMTVDQDLPWVAGDPVYASVWVKTDLSPQRGTRTGLLVQFVGDPQANEPVLGELKREVGGTVDWRLLEVAGTAPAGTQQLRVRLYVWGNEPPHVPEGQVYFDDAVLEQTVRAIPPQAALIDPGFENGTHDWQFAGVPATAVTTPVAQGALAARATVSQVAGQDFWSQLFQEISYGALQPLHATVQVHTTLNPSSTARAGLLLEFFDAARNKLGELKRELGGAGDFRPAELFTTTPAGTATVRYSVFLWAAKDDASALNGTATFDAAVLDTVEPPPPPPGTNLLRNEGFEDGLVDWLRGGQPASTISTPVHDGALSAVLRAGSTVADDSWSELSQEVPFAPDAPAYASAWVKPALDPLSGAQAGVMLQFVDAGGRVLGEFKRQTGGMQDWRLLELAAVAPAGTVKARYRVFLWAGRGDALAVGGSAYVDTCVLKQSAQQPIPQTTLLNPGFENGLHDWLMIRQATPPFVAAAAAAKTGAYGAEDTIENIPSGYYAGLIQDVVLTNSAGDYDARVWVKPQSIQGGTAGLIVDFLDAAGQPVATSGKQEVNGTSDWRELRLAGAIPAGTATIRFSVFTAGDPNGTGGQAAFDDASLTFPAAPVNQPPTVNAGADQEITLPASATVSGTANDDGLPNPPGALTTTWSQVSGPGTATFANANALTTTVSFSADGAYVLRLTATDGALSATDDVTVTVRPAPPENRAPVLDPIGDKTVAEGQRLQFVVSGSDPDGDALAYTTGALPAGAAFNAATQTFSWTPGFTQAGSYQVTFTVSDGSLADEETITITVTDVNRPPVLNPIGDKSVVAGQLLSFTVNGSDPDGGALTYTTSALPAGATFNAATRTFSWTPTSLQVGDHSITFTVTDAGGLQDAETITITVTAANAPPVWNPIGDKTVRARQPLLFTVSATDPDGDRLFYAASNLPPRSHFIRWLRLFVWWRPVVGVYQVTFSVTDRHHPPVTQTITITVTR